MEIFLAMSREVGSHWLERSGEPLNQMTPEKWGAIDSDHEVLSMAFAVLTNVYGLVVVVGVGKLRQIWRS
jgi:hypothetical protein